MNSIFEEQRSPIDEFLGTKSGDYTDSFADNMRVTKISVQRDELGRDWTYAMMHLVAQRLLLEIRSSTEGSVLLDVASQFSFISFAASFYNVVYLEVRSNNSKISCEGICNMTGITCEAQSIPIHDGQVDVITSLHAIEHFGLGRYGDKLDYFGDRKALAEFSRVLKSDGYLIAGVPTCLTSRIEFNGQRVYDPADFDEMVVSSGLTKVKTFVVYPPSSRPDGIIVGDRESLAAWPATHTPPVYLGVYKKV